MIRNDDGLVDFITSFLNKSTSYGIYTDRVAETHWYINIESIGKFVDIEEVEPRIRKIYSSSDFEQLDDQKKLAIKTFLDTIDGKIKNLL